MEISAEFTEQKHGESTWSNSADIVLFKLI
jgi:hypothetical protein